MANLNLLSKIKGSLSKFVFEFVIVFTGITLSFFFEEWRSARQEKSEIQHNLKEIVYEIDLYKRHFFNNDSLIKNQIKLLNGLQKKRIHRGDSVLYILNELEYFSSPGMAFPNLDNFINSPLFANVNDASVKLMLKLTNQLITRQEEFIDEYRKLKRERLYAILTKYDVLNEFMRYNGKGLNLDRQAEHNFHELILDPEFYGVLQKIEYLKLDDSNTAKTTKQAIGDLEDTIKSYLAQ